MTAITSPAPPTARTSGSAGWGLVLFRGGVLAAGLVLVVALTSAVLLPFGLWSPWVAWPVLAVGWALVWRGSGHVPATAVPWWAAGGTVTVALGHAVWAALTHAEHVIIRRDAGSYAQYLHWIATRHGLPVQADADAFGGAAALADPTFRVGSPAFYQVLHGSGSGLTADVVPQFLPGSPAVWSLGYWTAGWDGALITPALVSGLAVLAFGGLTARLVGPRWAPLAALALALTQPVLHAARSTYSEPVALLLTCAAACLIADAVRREERTELAARLALAAGLMVGLAGLVRVDVLREVALLFPVAAVLALRGSPTARPLVVGAGIGLGFSTVWAVLNSRPYLGSIAGSLVPLVAAAILLGVGSWAVVRLAARGRLARLVHPSPGRTAPRLATALVLLTGLLLASRPWWLVVRQDPNDSGSRFVARLQPSQGLDVDGGRTYAEQSVTWISWWVGPVAVLLALLVLAALAGRWTRWWQSGDTTVPRWFAPAFVGLGSSLLSLYRPGITPDHPWADRRLVTVVLPTVVLAAVAGVAWGVRRLDARPAPRAATWGVAALGALALVVPAAVATAPVADQRTERGQVRAVQDVCAALRPGDVVIAVDSRAINEWPQVIRGVCGYPAAVIRAELPEREEAIGRAARRVVAAGGRPVLLAANEPSSVSGSLERGGGDTLRALGLDPVLVTELRTIEDQRRLMRRPTGGQRLLIQVWLAPWQ